MLDQISGQHTLRPETVFGLIDVHARRADRIVDLGCKSGRGSEELAAQYPSADVQQVNIRRDGAMQLEEPPAPPNLTRRPIAPQEAICDPGEADIIVAWSLLERVAIADLPDMLARFHLALAPGGIIVAQLAPLFHSPFGSGLMAHTERPWEHLRAAPAAFARWLSSHNRHVAADDLDLFFRRSRVTANALRKTFRNAGFLEVYAETQRALMRPPLRLRLRHSAQTLRTSKVLLVNRKPG